MRTTAYHPQTDGLVERFNRTLIDMLTCYVVDEPEQWERFLPYVTFAYNTAVQSTLQECPFFLFFGRLPVLPHDVKLNLKYETTGDDAFMYTKKWMQAQRLARKHLFKAQEKPKFNYNLGRNHVRNRGLGNVKSTPDGRKVYQPLEWPIYNYNKLF